MKKLMFIAAVAALGIGMTGCVGAGGPCTTSALGIGGIIDENRAPASFNIDNSVKPEKKGILFFTEIAPGFLKVLLITGMKKGIVPAEEIG